MKLYIKQKVFSFGDKFDIYDNFMNMRYHVEGEVFTLGSKLHVYNAFGTEVAFIKQKIMTFIPKYEIYINGYQVAEVVQKVTFFTRKFEIYGPQWVLEGDFLSHEFQLVAQNSALIMRHEKHWFTWGDSYELDILNPANELICLCIALAVDNALTEKQ